MANDNSPDFIARPGTRAEGAAAGGAGNVLEKFKALPKPAQVAIIVVGLILVFYVLAAVRGGGGSASRGEVVNLGSPDAATDPSATFTGIETDRPAVMQSVFEQNRRDMSDLRTKIEGDFAARDQALQTALSQNQELQRQMQQMMGDFTTELKNMQLERARDNERLGQLADQQKQLELNAPVDGVGVATPMAARRRAISQVTIGGSGPVEAIARPFAQLTSGQAGHLNESGLPSPSPAEEDAAKRLPFMPPLGFVKATLINGLDAPIGGAIPALARLHGTYKTAMNQTVTLDGCFALIEFEGNLSTERATGKPTQMTCVYPDRGAATYTLNGYAVDAEDGIIGVPGVLFEGDAGRIGAAMVADFTAGIIQLIDENSEDGDSDVSFEQGEDGEVTLTSSQRRSQATGAANTAMSTIRDYLRARVDRIQSFIRLDATRQVDLVILNATEMRKEGDVWSAMFDANEDSGTVKSTLPANMRQPATSNPNAAPSSGNR